jgi:hypothetical protein
MATHLEQTVALDHIDRRATRAMIERRWRRNRRKLQINLDAMPLIRTDTRAGLIESEASLVVARYDLF